MNRVVSTRWKYLFDAIVLGTKVSNSKKCNLIDTNQESSVSGSNSNSMISKTPTSVHTLAGDVPKDDLDKTSNCLTIRPGEKFIGISN